jgi:hypothetical protein
VTGTGAAGCNPRGSDMRVLLAFDVDGTLDSSAGPVPVARLHELAELAACRVVIVSPSPARPPGFWEVISDDRAGNLRAAAAEFPADLRLYVSDNEDRDAAKAAGFSYVDRHDFR